MRLFATLCLTSIVLLSGCIKKNKQLADLLTPGTELNNHYSQKAPNINQSPKSAGPSNWTESRSDAMLWAENSKKLVLANFTGSDWCTWCHRLEDEVFSTQQFLDWAQQNVVLLKLDYPRSEEQLPSIKAQNTQLAQIYNQYITGYPTVLLLDTDGKVIGKVGYSGGGPAAWIASAEAQIAR